MFLYRCPHANCLYACGVDRFASTVLAAPRLFVFTCQRASSSQEGGSVFEDTDISKMLGKKALKGSGSKNTAAGYVLLSLCSSFGLCVCLSSF